MNAHDPIGSMLKIAAMIEGKRACTRIPIPSDAIIQSNGDIIEGKVENLSMTGAFVTSAGHLEVDKLVTVSIFNTLRTQTIHGLKARVVRVTEDGMALQFEKTLPIEEPHPVHDAKTVKGALGSLGTVAMAPGKKARGRR